MSGYPAYARYKNSVVHVPAEKSLLNAFFKVSEKIKSKYNNIDYEEREKPFARWKELECNSHQIHSIEYRQYAECNKTEQYTNFETINEFLDFLFSTNYKDQLLVTSFAISDDEFDEMPNSSNIENMLENEYLDDF